MKIKEIEQIIAQEKTKNYSALNKQLNEKHRQWIRLGAQIRNLQSQLGLYEKAIRIQSELESL